MTTTTLTLDTVYSDGSGAPAVVRCDGYTFALDFRRGEIVVNCIGGPQGFDGKRRKVAVARARSVYAAKVVSTLTPEWRALNEEMYK